MFEYLYASFKAPAAMAENRRGYLRSTEHRRQEEVQYWQSRAGWYDDDRYGDGEGDTAGEEKDADESNTNDGDDFESWFWSTWSSIMNEAYEQQSNGTDISGSNSYWNQDEGDETDNNGWYFNDDFWNNADIYSDEEQEEGQQYQKAYPYGQARAGTASSNVPVDSKHTRYSTTTVFMMSSVVVTATIGVIVSIALIRKKKAKKAEEAEAESSEPKKSPYELMDEK